VVSLAFADGGWPHHKTTHRDNGVGKSLGKGLADRLLGVVFDDARRGGKDAVGRRALVSIFVVAKLEEGGKQAGPSLFCVVREGARRARKRERTQRSKLTLLGVLAGQLGDGVADLVADSLVGFRQERLEELLLNHGSLLLVYGEECVVCVVLVILALFGGDAPKEKGGKRPNLWKRDQQRGIAHTAST
jgi:hypothetical protein